jgi:DNA-binding protein
LGDSFLTGSWSDLQKFFGLNGQTTADTTGMNASQAQAAGAGATLKNAGLLTSVFGGINSAIGGYYAAQSAQYQQRSQASSLQFQSGMDAIGASQAELSAQSIQEAGKAQVEQYTMRAGQQAASDQVATAARGVDLSSGSAVAQRASDELVKQIDVNTIDANTARAAAGQRTQETNVSNESLLAGVSASNMRASANTISPGAALTTSLLNSATSIASQWDWRRKLQLAAVGGN